MPPGWLGNAGRMGRVIQRRTVPTEVPQGLGRPRGLLAPAGRSIPHRLPEIRSGENCTPCLAATRHQLARFAGLDSRSDPVQPWGRSDRPEPAALLDWTQQRPHVFDELRGHIRPGRSDPGIWHEPFCVCNRCQRRQERLAAIRFRREASQRNHHSAASGNRGLDGSPPAAVGLVGVDGRNCERARPT